MAKYSGIIGYAITQETRPGVFMPVIIEREYYGDVLRDVSQYRNADKVNDDITVSNNISIVADPFACEHFSSMKYIVYLGTKWKIRSVEVKYPRLVISIGGVYNDCD